MVASSEKSAGRWLFGEELSCLSFWQLADKEQKGYLDCQNMSDLLEAFRFKWPLAEDGPDFEAEMRALFGKGCEKREFLKTDQEMFTRFDFMKRLFVKRGL